jgi:hypothetical protein
MKRAHATVGFLLVQLLSRTAGTAASTNEPVEVLLHFAHGLAPGSHQAMPAEFRPEERLPEILFLDWPSHFHVLLRNRTDAPLYLWQPYCPNADTALTFEFKEIGQTGSVARARISMDYTGGMGIPKVVKIAPKDALIIDVDFCQYWDFPFQVPAGKHKEIFLRAVYAPRRTERETRVPFEKMDPFYDAVWTGRIESPWTKVRIINRSTGDKPQPIGGRNR